MIRLKEIVRSVKTSKPKIGTTPYVEIGDLNIETKRIVEKEKPSVAGAVIAESDSILISKVRPNRGAVAFLDEQKPVSGAFAVLNTKSEICLPKYLFYNLAWNADFFAYLHSKSTGVTYPTVKERDLLDYEIKDLPDIPAQKFIIASLAEAENLMHKRTEAQNLVTSFIPSLYNKMFGNPESGFMNCRIETIGNVSKVTKLAGYEYTKYIKYAPDGDVIMVKALNVKNGRLIFSAPKSFITQEVSDNLVRSKLYKNDIVMTYIGVNIGDVALIEESDKYHLAPNVAKITFNDEVNPTFALICLQINRLRLQARATDTAKQALNMANIRRIKIPIPPPKLQNEFVERVKEILTIEQKQKSATESLDHLFLSLLSKHFSK